jgi:hypothetical protein
MPYIVTTKQRVPNWDGVGDAPLMRGFRRAVATLEEARQSCVRALYAANAPQGDVSGPRLWTAAYELPESGGTVGPLPDGTVIEVEPCEDCAPDRLCIWHEWPLREVQGQPE